jgi:ubiquitin-like 1-activating enzyme E1 A
MNPAAVFIILGRHSFFVRLNDCNDWTQLALWEFQSVHQSHLPDDTIYTDELENISNTLITKAEVNKDAFPAIPRELVE